MKAYMILSNKQIEPFGDHPRDCLITNRKLGDLQQETLQELGLDLRTIEDASQISDNNEYIIFGDNLFFTKKLLQEFIERSQEIKTNTICALKPGIVTLRSVVNTQDATSNAYTIELEQEITCNNDFNFIVSIPNLKLLPGDYFVSISSKLISNWTNSNYPIEYFIALEKNSTFNV